MDSPNRIAKIRIGTQLETGTAWSRPSSSTPQPHWKTSGEHAVRRADRQQVHHRRLERDHHGAEHHRQQQHRDADDEAR